MNMNAPETEEAFLAKAREALKASTAALPAEVLARLRESRRLAVEAASHPGPAWRRHGWVPAGALAAVFVAVLGGALWLNGGEPAAPGSNFAAGADQDMPIVLTNDSLDMYADMDFYQWMATDEDQSAAAPDDSEDTDDQDDDDTGVGG